jgi:hypothetical protein
VRSTESFGISVDAFSSRRQTSVELARATADEREAEHGRRPDARQMFRILRDVALRSRPPKAGEPLDLQKKLRGLRKKLREWRRRRATGTWATWRRFLTL